MSILIKGMEMPKAGQTITIAVNWDGSLYARLEPVGDWCPLVSVPTPHGRLIDADEYCTEMKARQDNCAVWRDRARENDDDELYVRAEEALATFIEAKLTLDKMPTIIEAEAETDAK